MPSSPPVGGSLFGGGGTGKAPEGIAFESFDVRVQVTADLPEVFQQIPALLPPDARPCPAETVSESFALLSDGNGSYRVEREGSPIARKLDLDFAVMLLESQLAIYVGLKTPGRMFVHAGVVEHGGLALVAPGSSFAGKTSLVTALVQAGAGYLSDEYAVIDEAGLVHPYAKPLSIRDGNQVQADHDVQRLGGRLATEPVPVGAVVFTEYRVGAHWRPQPMTPGRGVLAMLEHTLPVHERHREAMPILSKAIAGAVLLEGERGEASEVVGPLLEVLGGGLAQLSAHDAR